jgi:putative hemolysin
MITPLFFVPDSMPVLRLLNRFKKEKVHIAVVVDEHGTVEGLVTLADVIEAIAGDLPERGEDAETHIVRRADGSWLVDGTVPTDEVEIVTGIHFGKEVMVIAGFVLALLGRIPQTSESFRYGKARFEIVDMDRNRIDKILIEIDQTTSDSINNTE